MLDPVGKQEARSGGLAEAGRARLRETGARGARNVRQAAKLVRARAARRHAPWPALPWDAALLVGLSLIAVSALVLDAPVGAYRGQWPPTLARLARATTDVGLSGWYIVPSALVVVAVAFAVWEGSARRRLVLLYSWSATAFFVLCATGLSGLIATVLKRVIGRARPEHFQEVGAFAFDFLARPASYASFPSGHATTIGAVAAILLLFFPRWRFAIVPLAIWMGMTRVVTGVHYPSDVFAGLLFGSSFTVVTAIVFARLGYVFGITERGLPVPRRSLRFF